MTRLEQLLAEQAAIEADGGEIGPGLQGQLWFHQKPGNTDYPHVESGMQVFEQSDWVQEFLHGIEIEMRRSFGAE